MSEEYTRLYTRNVWCAYITLTQHFYSKKKKPKISLFGIFSVRIVGIKCNEISHNTVGFGMKAKKIIHVKIV